MKQESVFNSVQAVVEQLRIIGIDNFSIGKLGEPMRIGKPHFEVATLLEKDNNKVAIQLTIEKDHHNNYGITNYRLTLYDPVDLIRNGVSDSILDLDGRMKQVDWYFDLAEDIPTWTKGYKEVCQIIDELHHISHHTNGGHLAVYLWNNYVPIVAIEKPAFIQRIEKEFGLYPEKVFSAQTKLSDAIVQLKNYRAVEEKLSHYCIIEFNDKHKKYDIIGKLLDDKSESITLEKRIVPAEHIEKFVVVVNDYPGPTDHSPQNSIKQRIKEVGSSPVFKDALVLLHCEAAELTKKKPALPGWDIMVVGKYRNRDLEFNFEGTPEANTGHILATGYPTGTVKEPYKYEVILSEDLDKNIKVHESLNVQFISETNTIIFSDILKGQKEIDSEFWKQDETVSEPERLLNKRNLTEKKTALTNKEPAESLLPKMREVGDKRQGMKKA